MSEEQPEISKEELTAIVEKLHFEDFANTITGDLTVYHQARDCIIPMCMRVGLHMGSPVQAIMGKGHYLLTRAADEWAKLKETLKKLDPFNQDNCLYGYPLSWRPDATDHRYVAQAVNWSTQVYGQYPTSYPPNMYPASYTTGQGIGVYNVTTGGNTLSGHNVDLNALQALQMQQQYQQHMKQQMQQQVQKLAKVKK